MMFSTMVNIILTNVFFAVGPRIIEFPSHYFQRDSGVMSILGLGSLPSIAALLVYLGMVVCGPGMVHVGETPCWGTAFLCVSDMLPKGVSAHLNACFV